LAVLGLSNKDSGHKCDTERTTSETNSSPVKAGVKRKICDAGDSNKVISDWWVPYYVILSTGAPNLVPRVLSLPKREDPENEVASFSGHVSAAVLLYYTKI